MIDRFAVQSRLREVAGGLLRGGRVDLFLGYRKAGLPFRTRPALLTDPDDVETLVWGSFCTANLAAYLPELFPPDRDPAPRVGLVVKPCDSRAAWVLVREGRLPRDRLFLVGVRCRGVLDRDRAESTLGAQEALGAGEDEAGNVRAVVDDGSELTLPRAMLLDRACHECRDREPADCDVVLDVRDSVRPAESVGATVRPLDEGERRTRLARELSGCIACEACACACPLSAEVRREPRPAPGAVPDRRAAAEAFHADRARVLFQRCVGCGACRRACPAGVDPVATARWLAEERA
jgi:formate dehydrogenase (coenzyme F420) beta subunit